MPADRTGAARIAPLALPLALLALSCAPRAQAPSEEAPPYVFHFAALDEAAAARAEAVFRAHPSVARLVSNTRLASLQVWTKRSEGAARPQLLNTQRSARQLAARDLKLRSVEAPKWSKTKVYVVEATGGG